MKGDTKDMAERKATGYRQGRLKEGAKAPKQSKGQADDWELKGWLNMSKSGNMIKVSLGEGEQTEFVGLVSVKQMSRLMDGDISGTPIKMPPPQDDDDSAQES